MIRSTPKIFTTSALFGVHLYNLFLVVPLILALMAISLFKLSLFTLLLPLATLAATAYVLPFGIGNALIRRLAARIDSQAACDPNAFIVQIRLHPRLQTGLRALIEDADDIGILSVEADGIRFTGDSLHISLPFTGISEIHPHNVGIRGRFLYGQTTKISTNALEGFTAMEFSERSSLVLPESRRISKALAARLLAATGFKAR